MKFSSRRDCRVCSSDQLELLFSFDDYPMSDNFFTKQDLHKEHLLPFRAHFCLIANNKIDGFDWDSYYADYEYTVSQSSFNKAFVERIVDKVIKKYPIDGASVVEIGSRFIIAGCIQKSWF